MTRSAHRKSGICAVVAPGRNSVQFSAFITSEQERAAEVIESTAFHALRSNSEVDIRDQIVILWTMFVYRDNYFCLHTNSFPKKNLPHSIFFRFRPNCRRAYFSMRQLPLLKQNKNYSGFDSVMITQQMQFSTLLA